MNVFLRCVIHSARSSSSILQAYVQFICVFKFKVFQTIEEMKNAAINGLVDALDTAMSTPVIEAPTIPDDLTIGFKFL